MMEKMGERLADLLLCIAHSSEVVFREMGVLPGQGHITVQLCFALFCIFLFLRKQTMV